MSDMLDEMLEKDIDNTNNNTPPNGGGGPFGPYAFAKAVIEELRFHNFPFAKGIKLKCDESYDLEGREANNKYLTRKVLEILGFNLNLMYSDINKGLTLTLEQRTNSPC